MEVHHHPHVPNHVKPWKEYLIEGLMIFIAVSLGYGAENIREHYIEKKKAIISVQNLYKDLKDDSITYVTTLRNRNKQDSCFEILSALYEENKLKNEIPIVYAAHSYLTLRILPTMNTMALDQIKSSGNLNFIEDDNLKETIQLYSSNANGLKLREQREFGFIDKMLDPITTTRFEYKFYQKLVSTDDVTIENNKIVISIPIPKNLKIVNEKSFDWDNYFSIIGMLKIIRKSTDRSYILPEQKKCLELMVLVRKYLKENNALSE